MRPTIIIRVARALGYIGPWECLPVGGKEGGREEPPAASPSAVQVIGGGTSGGNGDGARKQAATRHAS